MLDWLITLLTEVTIWILARSTVEVFLFAIWLYLVILARRLTDIQSTLGATLVAIMDIRKTIDTVKLDVQGIRMIVYETLTATQSSHDAIEKIRERYAPSEHELERMRFEQEFPSE